MAGKPQIKNELTEELMEAKAFYANFTGDIEKILESIDRNEKLDRQNDDIRSKTFWFLLKALEAYSAKNYEEMDKFVHCAVQKLHEQERLDFADDKPRGEAKIKISLARQKAIHNEKILTNLLEKLSKKG
ncbi:MAG: hypothetical protein WCI77_07875 [Candidatus Omnitrophota bacterium]